ncbi:hypothetical protein TRFO_36712 [Tritrichomonas foetus]|uniref:Uncharacterized protein n=1 Tax=Tritrichomonas foetus TaxID=1144522 RepID=A0A1J4JIU2_9EUKA|nr:hypothetical protein TRFO_36712 [Tritrichomonas foetus]|eukprot:OHS97132.1 hypothetical protein TRFO_36712 [Tritrichomonas foetus]
MFDPFYSFFSIFKSSIIIFISFITATILFIIDNDPPTFPLPDNSDPIDCFNFVDSKIFIEKSRLKVEVTVRDFIQYPTEVATSLLNIKSNVGSFKFKFTSPNFWDLKSDRHQISFCALQTTGGLVNASLFCHNNLLSTTQAYMPEIEIFPTGWSRVVPTPFTHGEFLECCLESDESITFTSQPKSIINGFQASENKSFLIKIAKQNYRSYSRATSTPEHVGIGLISMATSRRPSEILFNTLIPLANIIFRYNLSSYLVLIQHSDMSYDLKPLVENRTEIIGRSCFRKMMVVPTTGSHSPLEKKLYTTHEEAVAIQADLIMKMESSTFDYIRTLYRFSTKVQKKLITIDEKLNNSSNFKKLLSSVCSECEIKVVNDEMSLLDVAKTVASSEILFAGELKTILFGTFLHTNSTLIEVTPDELGCFEFKPQLKKLLNVKYKLVRGSDTECICPENNLTCYFEKEHRYENIDKDLLSKSINNVFN